MRSVLLTLIATSLYAQNAVVLKAAHMYDGKSNRLVSPGLVVVNGGSIESVGKNGPAGAQVIDLGDATLLPGFIDAHTHLVFAGNRLDDFERRVRGDTYEQIANAGGGIWSTVEKTRAASEADLLMQAKKHAGWFLHCGTTTVE